MFYQADHSVQSDILKTERGTDFSFPPHMHGSFELIVVTEGEMIVMVDKKAHTVRAGQAALVFPHQVHALHTDTHSSHFLCIFSPKLVQAYSKVYSVAVPESNHFTPTPFYVTQLMALAAAPHALAVKGVLYALCAEFDATATYLARSADKKELIDSIFNFVQQNYGGACTLAALSAATTYHYVYLSRYFKSYTGLSFTDYVNRYRVNEACYLLKNTDNAVLQVALDCGFDSLRSFNRNFKRIMGKTPNAYRAAP